MLKYMVPLAPDEIPRVLLLGNGIHRSFDSDEWGDLLKRMSVTQFSDETWKRMSEKVPYPLLAVISSGDMLGTKMRECGSDMIAQRITDDEKALLTEMCRGFDTILTTNYTYEIEQALIPEFSCKKGRKCVFRSFTCQEKPKAETEALYSFFSDIVEDNVPPIWHIHGESARPDTMIIGHYYYGKLLSRIQQYAAESIRRHAACVSHHDEFYPRSWVDYFLFGDVTIVGQGMNFCEIDLWWLINCKKRNGCGRISYFEPNIAEEKQMLSNAYGVHTITEEVSGKEGYMAYYKRLAAVLNKEDQ